MIVRVGGSTLEQAFAASTACSLSSRTSTAGRDRSRSWPAGLNGQTLSIAPILILIFCTFQDVVPDPGDLNEFVFTLEITKFLDGSGQLIESTIPKEFTRRRRVGGHGRVGGCLLRV